ncbi:MAG TPA: winged helix-turn-helix domain-containing protein, partial [Pyrinomonadaceae bacterium]
MHSPARHLYEFDRYTLDASERLLLREGKPVRLTPKEFETLLALVRGAGRVMSKEELLKEIWPDTFVGEATLAQNVFTLRKALGEPADGGAFVETVPRRGYRFAVEVKESRQAEEEETAHALAAAQTDESRAAVSQTAEEAATHLPPPDEQVRASEPENADGPTASPSSTDTHDTHAHAPAHTEGHTVRAAVLIAAAVFASVAALVYVVYRTSVRPDVERASTKNAPAAFPTMKLTRLPVTGAVNEAVISPDGNYLAYVANEPGRQGQGVWVRQVAAASNMQQLAAPAEGTEYGALVFSPDSQHLYYGEAREGPTPPSLFRVPVFGGPAVKVLNEALGGPVTFSPDGRSLSYVRGQFGRDLTLVVADADGSNERALVKRSAPDFVAMPAWSGDGRTIACVYGSTDAFDGSSPSLGLTTFQVADGAERRVTELRWTDVRQLS